MKRSIILLIVFSLFSFVISKAYPTTIPIPDKIRVAVLDDASDMTLSIRGPYRIETIQTKELLDKGDTIFDIHITPSNNGIVFGKKEFKIYAINIIPEREPAIYLRQRLYRGSLQIVRTSKGTLRAINTLNLEDYLKGVLYHEVSHRWPMEAIKAQAIVSRTFALYQAEQNKDKYYYLKSDVSSQVYGGVYAEKYRTNKAIQQTKGKVLIYRKKILPAFFHATCGGRTEDVSMLWKLNLKPLKGIRCPYCINSPHFKWERKVELIDIEEALIKKGYKVSGLKSISIKGINRSGRAKDIIIKAKNKKLFLSAKDFRHIVGPRLIKSINFEVKIKGDDAYFTGKGWGHGVGMCQWGAFAMAKKREKAKDILELYYPGARISRFSS